jgi:hypothetical protein
MRRASHVGSSIAKKGPRVPGAEAKRNAGSREGTFLTSVGVESHLPVIEGLQVHASEDLDERLEALSQAIGLEGTCILRGALQAELNHVCRLAREVRYRVCVYLIYACDAYYTRASMLRSETDEVGRVPLFRV